MGLKYSVKAKASKCPFGMMVLGQEFETHVAQHPFNINDETSRRGLWGPGNQAHACPKGAAATWLQIDYCFYMEALAPGARPQILQEKPDI